MAGEAGKKGQGYKSGNGSPPPIGEQLVEAGLISREQLTDALAQQKTQGGRLVQNLLSLGHISQDVLTDFLARQAPGIQVTEYEVPRALVEMVPRDFAMRHRVIPLDIMGNILTVAMSFPMDKGTRETLEELTGLRVRALSCRDSDLDLVINAYYPKKPPKEIYGDDESEIEQEKHRLEGSFRTEGLLLLATRLRAMPPFPQTVTQLQLMMHDPEASANDMVGIVTRDPAFVAKLISLANSAALGFGKPVTDIGLAVRLLGISETFHLALSLATLGYFKQCAPGHLDWLLRSSWFCANASAMLGRMSGKLNSGELHAAGMLHHVGVLGFLCVAPGPYSKIGFELRGSELLEEERNWFLFTHAELGYFLGIGWDLPPTLMEAVRFHHHPDLATMATRQASCVAIGAELAERLGDEKPPDLTVVAEKFQYSLDILGLKPDALDEVWAKARMSLQEL